MPREPAVYKKARIFIRGLFYFYEPDKLFRKQKLGGLGPEASRSAKKAPSPVRDRPVGAFIPQIAATQGVPQKE
jgi:hypothetical protein